MNLALGRSFVPLLRVDLPECIAFPVSRPMSLAGFSGFVCLHPVILASFPSFAPVDQRRSMTRRYTLTHVSQVENVFTYKNILLLRIAAPIFVVDRRPGATPVQVQPTAREAKVRLCCLKMRTEMP
jgi:hypothetical protein